MAILKGLDISVHQTEVDWNKLKEDGYEFVYIKNSEGVGYLDKLFTSHYNSAKNAGLKVGIYHFATLNDKNEVRDANEEAQYFKSLTVHLAQDLWPAIDVETNKIKLPPQDVEEWIKTYYNAMGGKCILYSGAWFLNANLSKDHKLGNIPLWVSSYPFDKHTTEVNASNISNLKTPSLPVGWTNWLIWQWTGYGIIDGINGLADLDVANDLLLMDNDNVV